MFLCVQNKSWWITEKRKLLLFIVKPRLLLYEHEGTNSMNNYCNHMGFITEWHVNSIID